MSRVALVHDWLVAHRGGEKVLLELARLFPRAPIFTLVFDPEHVHAELAGRSVHTSFVQRLPGAKTHFRRYLPLFPLAIESFDLDEFDLVLSTSHCVAKGLRTSAPHICYVHTPMRYVWDQLDAYLSRIPGRPMVRAAARLAASPLRRWDVRSSARPSVLLANSAFVAARIARFWGRRASVLHPPVDVHLFQGPMPSDRSGYLVVNALVPYKRTELAVQFANRNRVALTIVGQGSERAALERLAGPTVTFRSSVSQDELATLYRNARALLHCGIEDFGIAPVEAMASGCPVVALKQGGLTETVLDGETGVLFAEPRVESLEQAVSKLRDLNASAADIRRHAERFSTDVFVEGLLAQIRALPNGDALVRNAERRA